MMHILVLTFLLSPTRADPHVEPRSIVDDVSPRSWSKTCWREEEFIEVDLSSDRKCKDPFGMICVDNSCTCKEGFPIHIDGVCLRNVTSIGSPCWVSQQCKVISEKAACVRSSGRFLEEVFDEMWELFVKSNQSDKFIPGKCGCDIAYKPVDGDCVLRNIGSSCRTDYECSKKVRFSICDKKKCSCPEDTFRYSPQTDECHNKMDILCGKDGSCSAIKATLQATSMFEFTTAEVSGIVGFIVSLGFILVVWFLFCRFISDDPSDPPYTNASGLEDPLDDGFFAFDVPPPNEGMEVPLEDEVSLPSYEEAIEAKKVLPSMSELEEGFFKGHN